MQQDKLIGQLSKLVSAIADGKTIDIEDECSKLTVSESDEADKLREAVINLARKYSEERNFILNLSNGNLSFEAPKKNHLIDPLKELQANLRHLIWQTKEITKGNFNQQVDFLGEFSESFNKMVAMLIEKKKLEEALTESEFFFKESQRVANIGSYKANLTTGYWESSETLDHIFGIDEKFERTVNAWIANLVFPGDMEMMSHYITEEVIEKKQGFDKEYRIVRQNDGAIRWVYKQGQVGFDLAGNVVSLIGTIQDITSRKQAEETLRINEERFRSLVENANDIIYSLSPDGCFIYVSPQWPDSLGHSLSEVINHSFTEFVHHEDVEKCFQIIQQICSGEKKNGSVEYRVLHKDGGLRWHVSNISPLYDEQRQITRLLGISRDITEQKKVEEALKKSEEQFRKIFDNSIEGIFQTTIDGKLIRINPAFAQLFGYNSTEEMMDNVANARTQLYFDTEERDLFIKQLCKNGYVKNYELKFAKRDGKPFWVSTNTRIIGSGNGDTAYLEGTIIDITEKKQAQKLIKLSEGRLKRAELVSHIGNWELHVNKNKIIASEGAKVIYGISEGQADYSAIQNIPLSEYRPLLDQAMKNLLEESIPYELEYKIKAADSGLIKDIYSQAFYNKNKRIVFGIIQDITDRKQAEETIRESEIHFRTLANSGQALIWTSGLDQKCNYFNQVWLDFTGRSLEQELGDGWIQGVHPDDLPFCYETYTNAFDRQEKFSMVYRIMHASGEYRYIQDSGSPRYNSKGEFIRYIGHCLDITKQKQNEDALRESEVRLQELNATKDKFFSIIAHDLKSPFNSIMGLSDLLELQIKGKDYSGIEEYATLIKNSSKLAVDLLKNLLEWSRSQTGRMEFSPEYIKIRPLTKEVISLLDLQSREKLIEIRMELPRNLTAFADKAMISTVLRNLISNALKFTNPGGRITLSGKQTAKGTTVTVEDNGIGMKAVNLEKIFRIDQNHSTLGTLNEKGTGLGLILCKEFIDKHSGKIWAESEPNKGSAFHFFLPKIER
jgi:PAS domain S-box-containing protein